MGKKVNTPGKNLQQTNIQMIGQAESEIQQSVQNVLAFKNIMKELCFADIADREVSTTLDLICLFQQKTTTVLTNIASTNQPCLILHS